LIGFFITVLPSTSKARATGSRNEESREYSRITVEILS
jgi:hypothetical protein